MTISISRRAFLKSSPLLGLCASASVRNPDIYGASNASQRRPVVISSANRIALEDGKPYYNGLKATAKAMDILRAGGDTLDAVIAGVNLVEDDPNDTSVGYGGLPNEEGEVQLDASVMHGPSRNAGAVAALKHIKNPSKVARLVMERTDHVMLVGEDALRFALSFGLTKEDLMTERSRRAWLRWRETHSDRDDWGPSKVEIVPEEKSAQLRWIDQLIAERPTGTINCLAVNEAGDISGVTTTSGLAFKVPGRVGDSPIIGAGLFVDNDVGAAGATGRGEEVIRICGAHTIVEHMRRGLSPGEACLDALKRIASRYPGRPDIQVTFYALKKTGEYASVSLWSGAEFAVTDASGSRIEKSEYLYERKARR
jgi:N4-(beta-N-acetylglucosaminyl)-L-asparaginase